MSFVNNRVGRSLLGSVLVCALSGCAGLSDPTFDSELGYVPTYSEPRATQSVRIVESSAVLRPIAYRNRLESGGWDVSYGTRRSSTGTATVTIPFGGPRQRKEPFVEYSSNDWGALWTAVGCTVFDLGSTYHAMNQGAEEGNPVLGQKWSTIIGVNLLSLGAAAYMLYDKPDHRQTGWLTLATPHCVAGAYNMKLADDMRTENQQYGR
ncbi:hypothetical protein E4T66_17340 [Sinimarinibacterium sp. CAU 1509]|uniref:hypothetical protein n=1 Tax=Sinimarinibacterium sp. CAU 1509 TaxID=2562283 RepID=UPI0010AC6A1D|nr:hypothetical protein [Sinimarinibacterium sp. CAU 1509]TJY57175.1 hypothetical protein E4T66_17340 [Sinimarinibacterium sp. CAU 1509]